MITPFKAMSFKKNDVITKDDMDTAQSNLQWLLDNTPRSRIFTPSGATSNERMVILCGRVYIEKSKKSESAKKAVRFGTAFSPYCNPNITTGVNSDGTKEIFCVVNGPAGKWLPNANGFEIVVTVPDDNRSDKWKISKPFHVTWQAFGYRRENWNDV